MNIFDLIGKVVITVIDSITSGIKIILVEINQLLESKLKKKVQAQVTTTITTNSSPTVTPRAPRPSNFLLPKVPPMITQLLEKAGWDVLEVHPLKQKDEELVFLKNSKTGQGRILGREAFQEYLKELARQHD